MSVLILGKVKCIKCGKEWESFGGENALKVKHYLLNLCEDCVELIIKEMEYLPAKIKERFIKNNETKIS